MNIKEIELSFEISIITKEINDLIKLKEKYKKESINHHMIPFLHERILCFESYRRIKKKDLHTIQEQIKSLSML